MDDKQLKPARARDLALRFISGKYQGSEFSLAGRSEVVIGRASDLDMVLAEDMVSRRHARIDASSEPTAIEDLGSTNGTFVNGEKVRRAALKEGDRILIGTSILKVVTLEVSGATGRRRDELRAASRQNQKRTITGELEEIPLPDILQLLGSSKKTGCLVMRCDDDVGRIYLRRGTVVFASINDVDGILPVKCVFRLLTWSRGPFEFQPSEEMTFPDEINASVQELLMEGLRQIDELTALRDRLPDLTAALRLAQPMLAPLRSLSPLQLDVLQSAHNQGQLGAVLDQSPATDLDAARIVLELVAAGYLHVD